MSCFGIVLINLMCGILMLCNLLFGITYFYDQNQTHEYASICFLLKRLPGLMHSGHDIRIRNARPFWLRNIVTHMCQCSMLHVPGCWWAYLAGSIQTGHDLCTTCNSPLIASSCCQSVSQHLGLLLLTKRPTSWYRAKTCMLHTIRYLAGLACMYDM